MAAEDVKRNSLDMFMLQLLQESSVSSMDTEIVQDNPSVLMESSSLSMSTSSRLSMSISSLSKVRRRSSSSSSIGRRWSSGSSSSSSFTKAISRWESYPYAVVSANNSSLSEGSSCAWERTKHDNTQVHHQQPAPPQLPRRRLSSDENILVPADLHAELLRIEEEAEREEANATPSPPAPSTVSPREAGPKLPLRQSSHSSLAIEAEGDDDGSTSTRSSFASSSSSIAGSASASLPPPAAPKEDNIKTNSSPKIRSSRAEQKIQSMRLNHSTSSVESTNKDIGNRTKPGRFLVEEESVSTKLRKPHHQRRRRNKRVKSKEELTSTQSPPRFPKRRESDESEPDKSQKCQSPSSPPQDNVVSCSVLDAKGNALTIKQALSLMNARLPKRRTSPNKIKAILSQATQSMMLEDPGNYLIRRAHNNAMDDDDGNHDLGQRLSRYLSEESLDLDDLERGSHSDGVGEMETNATDSEEELTCSQSI